MELTFRSGSTSLDSLRCKQQIFPAQLPNMQGNTRLSQASTANTVSFSGAFRSKHRSFVSALLIWGGVAYTLLLPGTLSLVGQIAKIEKVKENPLKAPIPMGLNASKPVKRSILHPEDRVRFKNINAWFVYLANPNLSAQSRSEGTATLKVYWDALRTEAVNGDARATAVLHGLWINRMFEEVSDPSPTMVRFDYPKFDELVKAFDKKQLTRKAFNTEVQWRAIQGLHDYYSNVKSKDEQELLPGRQELYAPLIKVHAENPDEHIQRWACHLMTNIFPSLKTAQKESFIKDTSRRFMEKSDGPQKYSALESLRQLYEKSRQLELWKTLRTDIRNGLKTALEDTNPKQSAGNEASYSIILSALLDDDAVRDILKSNDLKNAPPSTQQATAWYLGRRVTPQGLEMLEKMLQQPKLDPVARELAIHSVGEYYKGYQAKALAILNPLADEKLPPEKPDEPEQAPETWARRLIRDTAFRVREHWQDVNSPGYRSEDFYINKMLKTEAERTEFKRCRDLYVDGYTMLTSEQKRIINRALLPYQDSLRQITDARKKHYVTAGNATTLPENRPLIGKRIHDGRLNDFINGMSGKNTMTCKDSITAGDTNVFLHEFMHHVHKTVLENKAQIPARILQLYQDAVKTRRLLDHYSETNHKEWLAQAAEAMDTFKDHRNLYFRVFNNGFDCGSDSDQGKFKRLMPEGYFFLKSLRNIPLELQMGLHLLKTYAPQQYALLQNTPQWERLASAIKDKNEPISAIFNA